jgi:hyperosmotically inducible protein
MKHLRTIALATLTGITLLSTGCAVVRGQETVGSYVDDAAITTSIKAKFIDDKIVSAGSISVETLNGVVQLSGFAKSTAEKLQAEQIARRTKNVRSVRDDIVVRP